jgi:hypothetical protein
MLPLGDPSPTKAKPGESGGVIGRPLVMGEPSGVCRGVGLLEPGVEGRDDDVFGLPICKMESAGQKIRKRASEGERYDVEQAL